MFMRYAVDQIINTAEELKMSYPNSTRRREAG
jgi:hypothetical protein